MKIIWKKHEKKIKFILKTQNKEHETRQKALKH